MSRKAMVTKAPVAQARSRRPYSLVIGGAGFIGSNLAHRLASGGEEVVVFDNLSRPGVERNVVWLREMHGSRVQIQVGDVRDRGVLTEVVRGAKEVFHCAAQDAVTTSLDDPVADFEVNALGTLYVLEAARASDLDPAVFFTSTNKVYGALSDLRMQAEGSRCMPADVWVRARGIDEERCLDFHSPYGCSKGAADQYVLDYARSYGLRALVFRVSCIYGPRQFGTEDQGWVAHFMLKAQRGEAVTIYGDGRQVRDILFIEDLMNAFFLARRDIAPLSGQVFNIGGGPRNALSLLELVQRLEASYGRPLDVRFGSVRTGDQRYYISDTNKFAEATGWRPATSIERGLTALGEWLRDLSAEPISTARLPIAAVASNAWRTAE